MKLKSLILGSVAAAGLSTAGFAADLGVLTSLDVCDDLGISGLTISSDSHCLQISGEVKYEFRWGNYDGKRVIANTYMGNVSIDVPSALAAPASNNDWRSRVETWLKFVGTQTSDFGPASATIVLRQRDYTQATNGGAAGALAAENIDGDNHGLRFQEAWVSVGDTTVLAAGKKGSIFNDGDDTPFNTLTGLFISEAVDTGVSKGRPATGGHVIQLWTQVGEGLIAKIGLEALERVDARAGTLVGVLDYANSGVLTAHVSAAIGGVLDGVSNAEDTYAVHAAATGTFDAFKIRGAVGFGHTELDVDYWNALISGEATFDMFTVSLSAEAADTNAAAGADWGFGGQVGAKVTDTVAINLGGRYFNDGVDGVGDSYQVAAQLVASLTESVKLTTEIGVFGQAESTAPAVAAYSDLYGKAELAWAPTGSNFQSSLGATVQQNGAYKVTFKAAKSFQ